MTGAAPGDRTRLRRLHQRGHYDRDTIDAVLARISDQGSCVTGGIWPTGQEKRAARCGDIGQAL